MNIKIIVAAFLTLFILSSCTTNITPAVQTYVPSLSATPNIFIPTPIKTFTPSFPPIIVTQNIVMPTRIYSPIPLPTATQTSLPPSPQEIFKEFSGRYPIIDVNGVIARVLTIMPDGTFQYEDFSGGKTNLVIKGSVAFKETTIQLLPSTDTPLSFTTIYILTRWNPRKYLIEKNRKNEFCDSIMLESEPRNESQGVFFLKEGDWNLQIESLAVSITGIPFCFMD